MCIQYLEAIHQKDLETGGESLKKQERSFINKNTNTPHDKKIRIMQNINKNLILNSN